MTSNILNTWSAVQLRALEEESQCGRELSEFSSELSRVMETFGPRLAMEFAWEHFNITSLAFLSHFEMVERGEEFGVFAL